ncbi:MAG: Gfo/Idh/MocA family oxidoreductase [Pirellulales bacterium]|nr:Gfo/Idh/MocA family oxidoreductase [Pirellulales bacterium]
MIRIGIVGCGRILAAHLRGYRLLREAGFDDFRITALCARRPEDAQMYVRRGHGPAQRPAVSHIAGDPLSIGDEYLSDFQDGVEVEIYTDYRQMIAEAPIDAVNDFTTHALHHQVAATAFGANKHLLSQKPLAVSVAAARAMCEEADRRGLSFGIVENFRFLPETRQLDWFFNQSGRYGSLQMILLGYLATWWAPDLIVAETPWRHLLAEGGGITLDLGVHFFDQFRLVAGEIASVSARTAILEPRRVRRDVQGAVVEQIDCDADDTVFAQFETVRGTQGSLVASWGGHGAPTVLGAGSVFYGSQGRITGGEVTFDGGRTASLAALYESEASAEQRERDFPRGITDPFALNQLDWLAAIANRRPPRASGREGLADLAATFALLESDKLGSRVAVADVLEGRIAEYQRPINARFGLET